MLRGREAMGVSLQTQKTRVMIAYCIFTVLITLASAITIYSLISEGED